VLLHFVILVTVEGEHDRLKKVVDLTQIHQPRQHRDVLGVVLQQPEQLAIRLRNAPPTSDELDEAPARG
jgi:hypothetical protein